MSQPVPRCEIGGIRVLLFSDGPYVEVAERIRLVHKMAKSLCMQQGEIVCINGCWIYRATLTIGEEQYIGDAEISFGASRETPEGTHPISCGQTSAIGNALTFAGFGDIRLLLHRLKQPMEPAMQMYPGELPYDLIEGVHVVWLDETPYVPVAERLYHLHVCGYPFSMQHCEIVEVNGVWLYRVAASVNGHPYIADAEIHFDAPRTSLDSRYPVSCAQTRAVGTILGFAGFGDVRALLERCGKDVGMVAGKPVLASADAVRIARELASRTKDELPASALARSQTLSPTEVSPTHQVASHAATTLPPSLSDAVTGEQQATIAELCQRLGEPEPQYAQMTQEAALQCIAQLQAREEELLLEADAAIAQTTEGTTAPASPPADLVSWKEVGMLKRTWQQAFLIQGTKQEKREQWRAFLQQVCGEPVDETAMRRAYYSRLQAALHHPQEHPSCPGPSHTP